MPLQEALEALIDQTALDLVYDNALVAGATAHCRATQAPVEDVLRCVLRDTGLDFVRLSSGTYALIRAPREAARLGAVAGVVVDADTGAPMVGANVVLVAAGPTHGDAANAAGRFLLPGLLPGRHRVHVTFVGYQDRTVEVEVVAGETEERRIALRPEPVLSAPIVVSSMERARPSARLEGEVLETPDFSAVPAGVHTATPDVLASLGAVVGVRASDALADVHVQGGAVGEHQLTLDGAPVFAPVSLGGLVGPFSPFAISRVTVRKAGFGVMDGSQLAGVVDARHHLAPPAAQGLLVQADAMAVNARAGGRHGRPEAAEATWMVGARASTTESSLYPALRNRLDSWSQPDSFLLASLGVPAATQPVAPVELRFVDAHGAGQLRFGGLRSLSASAYVGAHVFGVENEGGTEGDEGELYEDAYRWTNVTAQATYEWVASSRVFAHVQGWGSGYRLRRPSVPGAPRAEDDNAVDAVGLRVGADVFPTSRQSVRLGAEAVHLTSALALSLDPETVSTEAPLQPSRWHLAGAAEDEIDLGRRTALTLGARGTWLPETGRFYTEPRVSLRHDRDLAPGALAVRVAAGRYLQFVNALDVADGGPAPVLPRVRFWLPLGSDQRPPEAYHLAMEASFVPGGEGPWEWIGEAYAKTQPHLLVPGYGTGDALFASATGSAVGAVVGVSRRTERSRVVLTYEASRARYRIASRFDGRAVPVPWEAPHRVRLSVDLSPLAGLTLTARTEAVVGRAWGFRQAYYDLLEPRVSTRTVGAFDFGDPGTHRLPAFVQVDLNAAYTRTLPGGIGLQVRAGLLNALGRNNVRDWRLDASGEAAVIVPRYGMPLVPEVSVRLTR